jgi:hypothetical protein
LGTAANTVLMMRILVKFLKLFDGVIDDFFGFFNVSPFLKPHPLVWF